MISSMSSPDGAGRTNSVTASGQPVARPPSALPDQISTESAAFLKTALKNQPEVRPEVVDRARALAADPAYPSTEVIKHIAGKILAAPDLSEDES
jgi:hypothetical protein